MTVKVDIKTQTVFRIFALAIATILGFIFIRETYQALSLILIAFFLAMALNPPVSFFASKLPGNSRGVATAISYLIVISVISVIIYATVPPLLRQSETFLNNIPVYIEDVRTGSGPISDIVNKVGLDEKLTEVQDEISADQLTAAGGPIFSFFQRFSSSAVSMLTVLVLTFFMLVEGPRWIEKFWELHPKQHRAHRKHLAQKMYRVVTGYVNGQLLVAFIAATSSLIAMSVLKLFDIHIPFIIPLAAIVGVFGLIPLIGATMGAAIVVTVSLFESIAAAVIMLIFFIVYQQVENNVVQPIIQAKSVDLSPLIIFIAAIIGVNLAGLLGAILAIPVAASIRILVLDYLDHHHGRIGSSTKKKKAKA